jgi:hypothetical protein
MDKSVMNYRKSSYSGANGGSCVEVGNDDAAIMVRDTTQDGQANRDMMTTTSSAWRSFTDQIKHSLSARHTAMVTSIIGSHGCVVSLHHVVNSMTELSSSYHEPSSMLMLG